MIHEAFHCFPGVEQSYFVVVKDIAVFIPRVLVVPGLKCKWSVNQIEIQELEPESVQTRLESRFDTLGPMIGVPQLCGNKNVFARDPSSGKSCLQRRAYLPLVPVSFRAIEVSKSGLQRVSGRGYRHGCIGNQGAEAQCRDLTGSVVERNSRHPKIIRLNHWFTPPSYLAFSIIPLISKIKFQKSDGECR